MMGMGGKGGLRKEDVAMVIRELFGSWWLVIFSFNVRIIVLT